jgi:LPXTG-site transpeptidase (sortase) family protein
MKSRLLSNGKTWTALRVVAAASIALGWMVVHPALPVAAAAAMSVVPIAWNTIGLDSNDVNVGPQNFPVGARVCNTGDVDLTNVTAAFIFDSTNTYINLRTGTDDTLPVSGTVSLGAGACHDFYYEVTVTRNAAAYDTAREYHITADSDQTSAVTTPQPRELYVEHLLSQNRNSVDDVKLDGVSVPVNGTMNLTLGNTYDITLISSTTPNGYEQIESFINFLNTVFRLNSVTASYTHDEGTDPYADERLYANGCNWDADPNSPTYRSCLGTGKYGGTLTITYNVTIIGGGGTNQQLSTLIYDYSGSSYHYNNDFPSTRFAQINDPAACEQLPIAAWDFFGDSPDPSIDNATGVPAISAANVTGPEFLDGNPDPGIAYGSWPAGTVDTTNYVQFSVSTAGYYAIHVAYDRANDNNNSPQSLDFYYSADGSLFTQDGGTEAISNPSGGNPTWSSSTHDLSSVPALDDNGQTAFRLSAFDSGQDASNRRLLLDNVTVSGCALPAGISLSKDGTVDQTVVPPTDETNVGDTINYTLVITNTGGVPLTDITLSDPLLGTIVCTPDLSGLTLDPGESTTCAAAYTLQASDFTGDPAQVQNCATADSAQTDPAVQACHTEILPPPTPPGQPGVLSIFKTANADRVVAGQQVTFTIRIQPTQTSGENLTNVEITDVLPSGLDYVSGPNCSLGSQLPDAACTYDSASRTIRARWTSFSLEGGTGEVSFVVRGNQNLECGGYVTNRATVAWDGGSADASVSLAGPARGEYGCPVRLPKSGFIPGAAASPRPVLSPAYDGNLGMSLDIPDMGIRGMAIVGVPLVDGAWDVSSLGSDAGWLETAASVSPGQPGNSVITAHVTDVYGQDGPFAQLDTLSVGDQIIVHTSNGVYQYQVQLSRVVSPDDMSILDHGTINRLPLLTLVTCSAPNYDTHTYDSRLIVEAVLVGESPQP